MSAITADDVGDGSAIGPVPRKMLIGMGMACQHRVRPYAHTFTDGIHLASKFNAGGMLATDRVGRMMMSKQERSRIFLTFDAFKRGAKECELAIPYSLVGDDAVIFEGVAIEYQDAHERRVESEENAGLDLCRAG